MGKGMGAGTGAPPPCPSLSRLLFVTGSDGCLPDGVASLFSRSDTLASWLRQDVL